MKKSDIDRMFIGELRTHTGPITICLSKDMGGARIIPHPDKQFMFELSVAYQSLLRRKGNIKEV